MSSAVQDALTKMKPDLIISCFQMAQYVPSNFANWVLDSHNIENEIWQSLSAQSPLGLSWLFNRERRLVENYEREIWAAAGAAIAISFRDANIMGAVNKNSYWLPVDIPDQSHLAERPKWDIGLIGVWTWLPNTDGLNWFVKDMLPLIRRKKYSVVIAGPGLSPKMARRLRELGVSVLGQVPSSSHFYSQIAMTIAPYRTGGGVRMKVAEALACGTPVLGTKLAFSGIDTPVSDDWVLETIDTLADKISVLLDDLPRARTTALGLAEIARMNGHNHRAQIERIGEVIRPFTRAST